MFLILLINYLHRYNYCKFINIIRGFMESMRGVIASLDAQQSFGFVDLHLTHLEQEALTTFSVQNDDEFNSFAEVETIPEKLSLFLSSIGHGDVNTIATLIHRIALNVITASGKETVHVIVRAFTPDDGFDMPRWHIDGVYYPGSSLKFGAALIGNPTRFYPPSEVERFQFKLDTAVLRLFKEGFDAAILVSLA